MNGEGNSFLVVPRRAVLSAAVVTGVAAVLTGCGRLVGSTSTASSSASKKAAVAASTGPHGGVVLEAGFDGKPVVVEVGPAVVVGDHTVVRIVMSNPGDEHYYVSSEFGTTRAPLSLFDVRMFSLDKGLVFPELNTSNDGLGRQVTKDDPVDLFPVFAAVDGDIKTVELLLPSLGMVTGVPVVGESQAGYSAAEVVAKAEFVASDPGPFKLQSHTMAADGSSDTKQDEKSTTVTVAGDVTFAVDSDQLSAQADAVLAGVVEQIRNYPSGGDLTITGHTDDVADDAYNQDLSERRAKAVAERLKTLTDLSTWKQSVSGKGESAPRVPNDSDERRQANRRVEINLKPSKPEEGDSGKGNSAVPSSTEAPSPAGPVGKGPEGVNVTVDGKTLRMSIDRVIRIGKYLAGAVALSSEQEVPMQASAFALPSSMQGLGEWIIGGVYSLTLLDGSTRYMEAGYEFPDKGQQPAAMTSLASSVQPGVPMHLPVVWPDTGGDSVTIDIPGGEARGPGRVVARLTDIPVVNG